MEHDDLHLPVTVVVSRQPKPGREADLVAWAHAVAEAASAFPGHLGAQVFAPRPPDRSDLVIVFSFRTARELADWEHSAVRQEWLARADAISQGAQHGHALTGFESIFAPSVGATKSPPPRWKTGVIIGLALFPLSLLLNLVVTPYLPASGNVLVDVLVRVTVSVLVIVPYMVYFAVPRLTKALRGWLHPKA